MLRESLWEKLPYPRVAACICLAKTACKTKKLCADLFVSPLKFQKRESTKQTSLCYLGLFQRQSFLTSKKLGGICYSYSGNKAFIANLFLEEEYRGKGLGHLLLKHALDDMDKEKVDQVKLAVADWNTNAIDLYKKCGFTVHEKIFLRGGNMMIRTSNSKKD